MYFTAVLSLSCFISYIDWVILWCNGISDTPDEEEGFNEIIQVEVQLICDTPFKVFSAIYSGGLLLINVQDDVFLIKYVLINNLVFHSIFCLNVLSETCNLKTCNISTTSSFVLEALFSGRLLVYQWAPIVHLCWLISPFIPWSTISWSKQ